MTGFFDDPNLETPAHASARARLRVGIRPVAYRIGCDRAVTETRTALPQAEN